MFKRCSRALTGVLVIGFLVGVAADASAIPVGWTCSGTCGTLGADGDVDAPPSGEFYEYVSTLQAPTGTGLGLGFGETNGSILTSTLFAADGAEVLSFFFNYVTSDGAGFPEYAWAALLPEAGSSILLFTARTCETGNCNTVPGTDMPPLGAGVSLNPPTTPIDANATSWSPLGPWSGLCFDIGCGNSGWIQALYTPAAGNYQLQFGVFNVNDTNYDSGMAIAGALIGSTPIGDPQEPDDPEEPGDPGDDPSVPEPAVLLLLGGGLLGTAMRARSRRHARQA